MTLVSRVKAAISALRGITYPSGASSWAEALLPRSEVDYDAEVGDGLGSNVIMAPVQWVARAFLEARFGVLEASGEGEKIDTAHDLSNLVSRPNPYYSGAALWNATIYSWYIDGNAYWIKNRNRVGQVKELWYIPHWMMRPKWDRNKGTFIDSYEYAPGGGQVEQKDPIDVVHMRFGIDPYNVRKGWSPIHSLLREIFIDDESANQVARLLANGCIPGVVISPKDGTNVNKEDLKATKEYIRNTFSGDNKGAPMALGGPTEIQQFGYDPKTMDLSGIRNVSEERVCALLGIPAAIVGFGSGMEQTKVGATLEELSKIAWRNGVIPTQELLAEEITRALGPDFGLRPAQRCAWDRKKVWALQDDMNKQSERLERAVGGPWITIAEARMAMGMEVRPEHDVLLLPGSMTPTDPSTLMDEPEPAPPAPPPQVVPAIPKSARRPSIKAAVRSKHAEMLRLLDGMAPRLRTAAARFMIEQAGRICSRIVESGGRRNDKVSDDKELAEVLRKELRRGVSSGLLLERDFLARLLKSAPMSTKVAPSSRVEFWAKKNAIKWAGEINETTYAAADQVLADALAEGLGISEASTRVADALDVERDYRTTRLAQTEMLAALNEGSLEAYRENEQVAGKGWMNTVDDFTRESHLEAGKTYGEDGAISVGEDFVVGEGRGPAPGQMGNPAEDCNCRCAIFPVVKEQA